MYSVQGISEYFLPKEIWITQKVIKIYLMWTQECWFSHYKQSGTEEYVTEGGRGGWVYGGRGSQGGMYGGGRDMVGREKRG